MMLKNTFTFITLLLAFTGSYGAQIYSWVDEEGHAYFGNRVPPEQKRGAEPVDLSSAPLSIVHGQKAVAARLGKVSKAIDEKKEAELKKESNKSTIIIVTSAGASSPVTISDSSSTNSQCQEQWRRYYESYACFNPYRLANGGIRAEGFRHCKEVVQPEPCE